MSVLSLAGAAHADPQTDYMLKCMGCHGPDGAEVVGKVPALKDNVARFLSVEGGRAYIVQVPGARQSPLPDAAMAELLNWLGPRFDTAHMPKDFAPYSADEVHELRKTRLTDVSAIRARLIALIAENEAPKK
ncbi:MAG: c-type cytochrome [Parvibaculaceae bacterium]